MPQTVECVPSKYEALNSNCISKTIDGMNCLNILTSMSSKVFLQFFRAQKFQE
jgi:hypothetical protein